MDMCGQVVTHKVFGKGKIIEFANNYVIVLFDGSKAEKKFTYPSSFGTFLKMENKDIIIQIDKDKDEIASEEAESKRIIEEQAKVEVEVKAKGKGGRRVKKASSKTSDRNNIAFKCNFCDGGSSEESVGFKGVCSDETIKYNINVGKHIWCSKKENMCYKYLKGEVSREDICAFYDTTKAEFGKSVCYESQMLGIWKAGVGITQGSEEKGKPAALRNVKANSLAVLTTKFPHAEDEERFIFAIYLIEASYEGDSKDAGYVGANPKYRMQFSPEEARQLKFWDYYFNPQKPEKIFLRVGQHRYLTDAQSAQILKKVCEIKKGTPEEDLSKEFLGFFCRIKKLNIDNISVPNGALKRIMKSQANIE